MKRIEDTFVSELKGAIDLKDSVLEIGCGEGTHSEGIAAACQVLTAIDPDEVSIAIAKRKGITNAVFMEGDATDLLFPDDLFDIIIFTMSLHHVCIPLMKRAIDEALRVVKPAGHIVFLEPEIFGTFYEAETRFNAGDGDEQEAKKAAYEAMWRHAGLDFVAEIPTMAVIRFDSLGDFVTNMKPKQNLGALESFLEQKKLTLKAPRRIYIFKRR
ncbi:MAG: class I SAM-dependent methyltransferase [Candidatus Paceibacteria bacterium]